MLRNAPSRQSNDSPFFGLLAEADEIQIREISLDDPARAITSVEKTLKDFEGEKDDKGTRSFFVHIKTATPAPKPAPAAPSLKTPEPEYDRTYLQNCAELLLESREYVLARNIFSFLLKGDVREKTALRGLGICLYRLGENVSAKKCFRALCELHASPESYAWLGQCCLLEGNDLAADENFKKVSDPAALDAALRFDFYKGWGNCLTRLGRIVEAEALYSKALALQPDSDILQVNLGTLCLQKQDPARASAHFEKALSLNPRSSKAACGLGLVSLAVGNRADAERRLHAALDLDGQNLVALHQLVSLVQDTDNAASVKPRLVQYLQRDPGNAEVNYALAVLLFKEGAWRDCEGHVEKCLHADPHHARALRLREDIAAYIR